MNDYFALTLDEDRLRGCSELALAHVGDAVFELMVRTHLLLHGAATNHSLHRQAVEQVSASAQAGFVAAILPLLSAEETAVYKRGRNVHVHQAPKSATPGQYARATGLETLFGWLYLRGERARLNALFTAGMEAEHGA